MRVFDRLGRKLWEARSEAGTTLVLGHESDSFCRIDGPIRWRGLEDLGALEPAAVPALLLGRVPGRPPRGASMNLEPEGRFRYPGSGSEVWTGVRGAEGVISWILTRGGEPSWWWTRSNGGGILSQREGRQVRWELVTVERLGELPSLEPPSGYREGCAEPGAVAPGLS